MELKTAYIALTILVLILIIYIGFNTINKTFLNKNKAKKKKRQLVLGLLFWQVYIIVIGLTGVLETFELPPRFPIFLIFPVFLFTGIFLYKNRKNEWIKNIKPETIIYFQTFRVLVEILFVYSVTAGVLVKNVTIEGYNFDMIFAFTAPIIAYLVFNTKHLPKKAALLWNYIGLVVLASVIVVFFTTVYTPELYGNIVNPMPIEFTTYPYILIVGFLMPVAVFFHILSIVQLSSEEFLVIR